jgi:hypothetical protein
MQALIGVLFCLLAPAMLFGAGYYIGRYGSPVRLSLHGPADRRRGWADDMELEDASEAEAN